MSFVFPAALGWFLLAIPIVVLYLLRVRTRRVPVSTVLFWDQVFEENRTRALWLRLRHLISLAAQLLLLALMVLALGEPTRDLGPEGARRWVIVIDDSASMSAREGEDTRLDRALEEAGRLVAGLGPGDSAAILTAGGAPRVVAGFTGDAATLHDGLERVTGTDAPTRVGDAVDLARRILGAEVGGTVVVLTDGAFESVADLARASDVRLVRVAAENPDNWAITLFQARRSAVDPLGYDVLIEVRSFAAAHRRLELELSLDGGVLDVAPIELEPGASWTRTLRKTGLAGGVLRASLNVRDGLAADDEAHAIIPARRRLRVALAGDTGFFLRNVLAANPQVALVAPEDRAIDVLVVQGDVAPGRADVATLVVGPTVSGPGYDVASETAAALFAVASSEHPILRQVRLDDLALAGRPLVPTDGRFLPLLRALDERPVLLASRGPAPRVVVLGVDVEAGDLPLRTAFPILVSNALAWLVGESRELEPAIATGGFASLSIIGAGDDEVLAVIAPDGSPRRAAVRDGRAAVGPLATRGIWTVRRTMPDGVAEWRVACNLSNAAESDLAARAAVGHADVGLGFGGRPPWFHLALVAALLLGVEWLLFQRRIIA